MNEEQKRKLSEKYQEGLYGIWRPKKKRSEWPGCLLLFTGYPYWYFYGMAFPRKSYYLFGSFEVKDPGIETPYEMSEGERDFYLRCKAYDRACKIGKIYFLRPWEEPETPSVFLKEIRNNWNFVWSNNASPYTRMLYFLFLMIRVLWGVSIISVLIVLGYSILDVTLRLIIE